MTAMCQCNQGMAPCPLIVADPLRPLVQMKPVATIMDNKIPNLPTFGMCRSMANPTVSAATSAAMGVLTPMPCLPVIVAPWNPASKVLIKGQPAVMNNSKCMCQWGGQISITNPGHASSAECK